MSDDHDSHVFISGRALPRLLRLMLMSLTLAAAGAVLWFGSGSSLITGRALGIPTITNAGVAAEASISLPDQGDNFQPRAVAVVRGGAVQFLNDLSTPMHIKTAARSAASFSVWVPPHGHVTVHLRMAGLYHYYDALTAHQLHVVANNAVLAGTRGNRPREGWVAVLPAPPGLQAQLTVPNGQDLFAPKALVTTVGASVVVTNHDGDTHNFVIDPASPTGAAFLVDGSSKEPPSGWQRLMTVQQTGLYHVYCTMHTKVVGSVDGWQVLEPRRNASGYHDHNPMEAWIIALPA